MSREAPYISIRAEAPLDPRWTPELWFAWCRLLATCRLKRACTAESWPAAVLRLRPIEAASILNTTPNHVASVFAKLSQACSLTVHKEGDRDAARWVCSVDKYAEYQKLGRPTYARSSGEVSDPPLVPSSPRTSEKKKNPPTPRGRGAPATDPIADAWPAVQAAFGAYAGAADPRKLTASRASAIRATIADGLDPVACVHGYMAFHDRHGAGFDPLGHFTPETVFRAANRAKYAEAAARARAERGAPPWPPRGAQGALAVTRAAEAMDVTTQAADLVRAMREGRDARRAGDRVLPADVLRLRPTADT